MEFVKTTDTQTGLCEPHRDRRVMGLNVARNICACANITMEIYIIGMGRGDPRRIRNIHAMLTGEMTNVTQNITAVRIKRHKLPALILNFLSLIHPTPLSP